jgi:hypothetical protein
VPLANGLVTTILIFLNLQTAFDSQEKMLSPFVSSWALLVDAYEN